MNKLDEINAKLGDGWTTRLENVYLAFDESGLKGAHFTTASIRSVEGEEPIVRIGGPFSATQGDFESLFGTALNESIATIEGRDGTIDSREIAIDELMNQLDAMTADRDRLSELSVAKETEIVGLKSLLETLKNPPKLVLPSDFNSAD